MDIILQDFENNTDTRIHEAKRIFFVLRTLSVPEIFLTNVCIQNIQNKTISVSRQFQKTFSDSIISSKIKNFSKIGSKSYKKFFRTTKYEAQNKKITKNHTHQYEKFPNEDWFYCIICGDMKR